jgi:hypothetical protein
MSHDSEKRRLHYSTYILCLWEESGALAGWRFSLENPRTGERYGFADPMQLLEFLKEVMRQAQIRGKIE